MGTTIQKIKVEGAEQAKKEITGVQGALDAFNDTTDDNRDAVQLLDKATGGAITSFKRFQKGITQGIVAVKGLSKSFKGMRTALIATGIGAFVVALGLVVTYWDDIVGFISGATAEQERLNREVKINKDLLNDEVDLLFKQLNLQELKGESIDETLVTLKKTLLIQKEKLLIELQEAELAAAKQKAQDEELGFFDKLKASFVLKKGYNYQENLARIQEEKRNTTSEEYIGLLDTVNKIKGEINVKETQLENLEIKKAKRRKKELDDIKKIQDLEFDEFSKFLMEKEKLEDAYFQGKLKKEEQEENIVRLKYFSLIAQAKLYKEDTTALEEAREAELKAISDKYQKERDDKKLAEQKELIEKFAIDKENEQLSFEEQRAIIDEREKILLADKTLTEEQKNQVLQGYAESREQIGIQEFEAQKEIELAKYALLSQFGGLLSQLAGENKTLAIAGVVATQAAAVGSIVSETGIANAKAVAAFPTTFGQPWVGINTASAGLSIASSIAAASQSISKIKSSDSSASTMNAKVPGGGGAQ